MLRIADTRPFAIVTMSAASTMVLCTARTGPCRRTCHRGQRHQPLVPMAITSIRADGRLITPTMAYLLGRSPYTFQPI